MSTTGGALTYLAVRSFVNRVRVQFRRVKTPRYAIAFLFGAYYLWFVFSGGGYSRYRTTPPPMIGTGDLWPVLYETLLAISAMYTWLFGAAEPAIAFTPADVQMLFPAPVSRQSLVRLKLAQVQIAILFSVLLWLVLLQRTSPLPALPRAFALWVLFTTLYLHRVGASFVKVSAAQRGLSGVRRNLIPIAVAALAIGTMVWGVVDAWPQMQPALAAHAFDRALLALRDSPQVRVVVWPFHALVAPAFAPTFARWLSTIGWALLLLALCYVWVMRAGVGFEEAAMQRAERVAAQQARQRGRTLAPVRAGRPAFVLKLAGHPTGAIVWKNVTAFKRLFSPRQGVVFVIATIALATLWMRDSSTGAGLLVGIAGGGIAWLALFGAIAVRVDLQQDMLRLQLLRTYPLSGAALVGAEIGASVAILCAFQGLLLAVALIAVLVTLFSSNSAALGPAFESWPKYAAALIALPAVTALRVAVANGWAVLFPGWVQLGPARNAGIEAIGANMLTVFGSMLAHLLLMLIPGLIAAAVYFGAASALLSRGSSHVLWPLIPAAMMFVATALGELWLIVRWLGGVVTRTDPSAVDTALA